MLSKDEVNMRLAHYLTDMFDVPEDKIRPDARLYEDLDLDSIDAVAVDRHLGWSPFSWPINLAGLPAATIPCGFDAGGLPIGLQIVAPWLDEATVFRIAAAFEAAKPWVGIWPAGGLLLQS